MELRQAQPAIVGIVDDVVLVIVDEAIAQVVEMGPEDDHANQQRADPGPRIAPPRAEQGPPRRIG